MILYNIMQCNAVLSQMIQYHIIIRYNIISFDSKTYLMPYKQISYNMIQYCLVWYNTILCIMWRYDFIQYKTIWYSTYMMPIIGIEITSDKLNINNHIHQTILSEVGQAFLRIHNGDKVLYVKLVVPIIYKSWAIKVCKDCIFQHSNLFWPIENNLHLQHSDNRDQALYLKLLQYYQYASPFVLTVQYKCD